jgi:hypothetical protein
MRDREIPTIRETGEEVEILRAKRRWVNIEVSERDKDLDK